MIFRLGKTEHTKSFQLQQKENRSGKRFEQRVLTIIKKTATLALFLILSLFLGSNKSYKKATFHKNESKTILRGDSGFVSKENIDWLLKLNKNDSVDLNFNGIKSSDTIGKFYKKPNSYNYYVLPVKHHKSRKLSVPLSF